MSKIARRKLKLDRQHLVAMLSDPEFYAQCPYFLWLRKTAMRAFAQLRAEESRNNCHGCGSNFAVVKHVVDAFFTNLKELNELDPQTIDCVRAYLEAKKGYPIESVVIVYRSSKRESYPKQLQFKF